ncbi:UNVERIFIED_CONTAM: Retrovirus-related Pol polyprotein from transposon TNT 1-94 [Sesamum radiatum]|uniref:Retrovirus-related Pol polyprotein from transposon TNT 1-94 n=1 Tax=Sesamum radiatum TaxID=300843 RepID=A0AAW2IL46_SESRA
MAQANLPTSFWGDAILTAAYILNRVPSKSIPTTSYELWHGRKPNLEGLRPWGSAGFVHSTSHKYGKLGPRASKLIFIRYCEHSKGYVMYCEHPDKGMTEIGSRDVDFLEEDFPSISEVKGNLELYLLRDPQGGASITVEGETPNSYPVIDGDNESDPKLSGSCSLEEHNSQNPQMRRSKRGGIPRRLYEIEGESIMCASVDIDEPATYEEVVTSPNANEWITEMKEEMSSMAKNNVWELVDLPAGRKTIGNKWVLKVKRKADGSIDKFKARLVAKGYTQREGIDYEETFSPVVRFASVLLILAIVAHLDLELFQIDVKTAFLNGELDEEIYMDQPEGFQEIGQKRKVCRLKCSIYGLKQSSRQYYYRFHRAITSMGFTMVEEDHCVYVKRSEKNFIILSLYVDDILLAGNNMELIVATQKWLSSTFEMKDMGEADTPIDKSCVLSKELCPKTEEEKKRMTKIPYASAVGSLMYAMMCTRPDLCFAVGMVSRYQSNPGPDHWVAVKRILRYLKGTSDLALCYHGGSLRLVGYSDADGSADRDERKSTSGYAFLLGGAAITWCSKKQPCISLSTMEAEYVACTSAVQKAI